MSENIVPPYLRTRVAVAHAFSRAITRADIAHNPELVHELERIRDEILAELTPPAVSPPEPA